MKFEVIVSELGDFGTFQKRLYFLLCVVAIPHAFQTLGIVFTMGSQQHRCSIPDIHKDAYSVQGDWHGNLSEKWIPIDKSEASMLSSCRIFVKDPASQLPTNETEACSQFVYNTDVYKSTVTSDLDLVCEHKSLKTYANMIYMGGMLVGSLLMGTLSDVLGRRKTLLLCIIGHLIVSLAIAFVTSYVVFALLRFCTAVFGIGLFMTAFVIGMEIVGPRIRKLAGIIIELFFVLGEFINALLAYLIRDWKYLQIATAVPTVLLLSYVFLIPESPRWLIRKRKYKQASNIIQKAGHVNKVTLSPGLLSLENIKNDDHETKIWHMFTTKVLLVRTLVLIYNWFACSMVYFGLSLNVGALSGNIYINVSMYALVEGISYIVCFLLLDRAGRKPMLSVNMAMAGVACLATMFPVMYGGDDLKWVTLVLSMIGKFGSSVAFAVVYIYSAEVFPTTTRNSGIGVCSFAARIGGILAPYIADLGSVVGGGDLGVALPLSIFGGIALLAGLLALLLPETTDKILPESLKDAKEFGRHPLKNNKSDNFDEKNSNGSYDLVQSSDRYTIN